MQNDPRAREPHQMPVPPLPEQPGRTPVPARDNRLVRDACFAEWMFEQTSDFLTTQSAFREAFRAGWDAHKKLTETQPQG